MLVKTNAMPTNHRETLAGNAHNDVILFYLGNFTSMCVCVCVCVCVFCKYKSQLCNSAYFSNVIIIVAFLSEFCQSVFSGGLLKDQSQPRFIKKQ